MIQNLAGKMPLDIVVITHTLNEHLIEQMLREIDRLETLRISLSVSNASPRIYGGIAYAAHAFVCQSSMNRLTLVHDGRGATTKGVSI